MVDKVDVDLEHIAQRAPGTRQVSDAIAQYGNGLLLNAVADDVAFEIGGYLAGDDDEAARVDLEHR